jgi:hypothetical protein
MKLSEELRRFIRETVAPLLAEVVMDEVRAADEQREEGEQVRGSDASP